MIICSHYKRCRKKDCDHKVPHDAVVTWTCQEQPCNYRLPRKYYCEEELYVYMREAIDDKGE